MTSVYKNDICKRHDLLKLEGGYTICVTCGECFNDKEEEKIPLRPLHYVILEELYTQYTRYFKKNRTRFFYSEMYRYIYEKKVFRIRVMGETRGGKSEIAQTIALNYVIIFNALLEKGHFGNVDIIYQDNSKILIEPLLLDSLHIHANESAYLYHLRDSTREKRLKFGQVHIIDEDRENIGGIGSFSEELETENLNNIVAKFMQSEVWIKPKRFENTNTPYGINCLIKDELNRKNWCLLYKLEMFSGGIREQNFLGWIGIGLHENKNLRNDYQQKKNLWIEQELKGTINERANRRMKAIEVMLLDEQFTQYKIGKDGNIKWYLGVDAMKFLVEKAMMEQRIDQFNDTEIERIVHGARAMGEQRLKVKNDNV